MRHFTLKNFRGIEVYADATDLDRGSLRSSKNVAAAPRGALCNGVVWRSTALPGAGVSAFNKRLDYLDVATANGTPGNYLRSREDFPIDVNISVMSNKGALFMAGDADQPQRVWIAEPAHKRESVVTGIDSAVMSYVDIINVGPTDSTPTIRALSVYGPYIYAHHEYGITALYDVEAGQDPTTGFRVRQSHTPVPVGLPNHNCAFGDVWLGYDGQLWNERVEAGPPEKFEGQKQPERVPSYKSTGGFEHLLADGWQSDAFSEWVPQLNLYVFFAPLKTGDMGMFLYDRAALTLSGPFNVPGAAGCVNPLGTSLMYVRFSNDTYAWADFGEFRERDLTVYDTAVPPPGTFVSSVFESMVEFNWEDLGDTNTHKSFEELQLNFQHGSYGQVAVELENERGQISGSRSAFRDFSPARERIKFFVNLNGRRVRFRLYFNNTHGRPWVLRDMAIGYTPGVEL